MMIAWIFFMAIVVVIVIILALPLEIQISGNVNHKEFAIESQLYILGILFYRYTKKIEYKEEKATTTRNLLPMKRFVTVIEYFFKRAFITRWQWNIDLGLDDAALTGAMVGFAYIITGIINNFLMSKIRFQTTPNIVVIPHFQEFIWQMDLHCIVKSRLGKAIYAAIRILILLQRRDTHGGTSNPVPNVHHT